MSLIDEVEKYYIANGIVSRKEFSDLDMHSCAESLIKEMHSRGYDKAQCLESGFKTGKDYSSIIYDTNIYTPQDAEKYLYDHVLNLD